MDAIKKYDVVICINQNDSHYLNVGQVEDVICDKYYPITNNVSIRYKDERITYKSSDMEYNFIVVNGKVLMFD